MDEGRVYLRLSADPGTGLDAMDRRVRRIEARLQADPRVRDVFAVVGGFIFGRTQRGLPSRATLYVQLRPCGRRAFPFP